MEANGLSTKQIQFTDEALLELIRKYTRESGVRNLEREIANVCRKTAKKIVTSEVKSSSITPEEVEKLLGRPKFRAAGDQRDATRSAWRPVWPGPRSAEKCCRPKRP